MSVRGTSPPRSVSCYRETSRTISPEPASMCRSSVASRVEARPECTSTISCRGEPVPKYHLPPTATKDDVTAALRTDGFVIVDNLVPDSVMDRVADELEEYVDLTPPGLDDFVGRLTRRTGSLIARSPASRELVQHPLVLGAA